MKSIVVFSSVLLASVVAMSAGPTTPPLPAASTAADAPGHISGKVVETMDAAGYTYLLVDTGPKKVWAAAPKFPVKVGDSVSFSGDMAMENYHSKTLNRDFPLVYFTGRVGVNAGPQAASGDLASLPKGHPAVGGSAPKMDFTGLKPAAGGKKVSEICLNRTQLKGQQVTVRGKVVKYNPGILGRNWIHIRDGSGSEGSDDLLVTSALSVPVKIGDTVLVTGKVATDKDFGAGYKYAVMLEDAKVVVE